MTFKIEVLYKPFADQVRGKLKWDGDMRAIIDARLGSKYPVKEYKEVIDIALQCTIYDRNDRPKMQVNVHRMLAHTHSYTDIRTHTFIACIPTHIPNIYLLREKLD